MTADKRKVTTDALETLGTIIGNSEGRDAIHLAVEPVEAGERLKRGEHVYLRDGKAYGNTGATGLNLLGIVDPFIDEVVQKGQRFWLVVYPRQITSLRHVWTHPAFPEADAPPKRDSGVSRQWLEDWLARSDVGGLSLDQFLDVIDGERVSIRDEDDDYDWMSVYMEGDWILCRGFDAHGEIPPEVWVHVENVTGKAFIGKKPEFFSCSC